MVLGAALAFALLTLLHHWISDAVGERFDRSVQFAVHGWTNPWLTRVMLALTWIGAVKIFLPSLGIVLVALFVRRHHHAASLLSFAMAGAFVLNETLKQHFHRPRPLVAWSIGDEHTYSFPSGHSLFSVVLYGTLAYLALQPPVSRQRRLAVLVPAVLLPLAIGLSRIYLGMHFPTDVLGGFLAGSVCLATVVTVDRNWRQEFESKDQPSVSLR